VMWRCALCDVGVGQSGLDDRSKQFGATARFQRAAAPDHSNR
jgi:hypothetical protein